MPAYAAPSESTTTSDDQIAESPEVYASPEPVSDLRLISPIIISTALINLLGQHLQ